MTQQTNESDSLRSFSVLVHIESLNFYHPKIYNGWQCHEVVVKYFIELTQSLENRNLFHLDYIMCYDLKSATMDPLSFSLDILIE